MRITVALAFTLISTGAFAQMTTTFPLHEDALHGVLDNGMNYYILHNEEPKERASFFFVQTVGAILEEDSQNGLAHFLEHMAFNGTKHFEGKGIIDFLEKHGVRFGYDINAGTSRDETIYNLSNIPINAGEGLLDSCLLVMHDWSGYLLLSPEEIESERGVIHEEWRTRRNSQFRLNQQTSKVIYKGSKYAERDVIGDLDIIDNFKHQELKDYYQRWYRPDQQAVVVVGDIDAKEVEKKVKELFSQIPLRENLPEREYFSIPDNEEVLFGLATDPEAQFTAIMMINKSIIPLIRNEKSYRTDLIQNLYTSMINMRFQELQQDPESNSLMMQALFMPLSRQSQGFAIMTVPKPSLGKEAFSDVVTEVERVKREGFTTGELERAKTQIQSQYDNFLQNKDKISNDNWSNQFGNHFLQAQPVFSPETEYDLMTSTLAAISLNEINAFCNNVPTDDNNLIIITGPEKEGVEFPTKDELISTLKTVQSTEIESYTDEVGSEPLVADELKGGKVISKFDIKGIDAKGYVLSNGAKVVLMPTEFEEDEILFTSFSYGGTSRLDQKDLASADLATSIAQFSGLGNFDMVNLQKKLTGKIVNLNPYLNTNTEGFSGSSNKEDFETLLQLIYLNFESPRFDEKAYQVLMNQINTLMANRKADNNQAMQDTIDLLSSNYNERTILFDEEMLVQLDYNTAVKAFKDRFDNPGDFSFIFVGSLTEDVALPIIEKYLGSIPGEAQEEAFVDHNIGPAKGKTVSHFSREMEVPKTTVYTALSGEMKYDPGAAVMVSTVGKLLDKRYMETIREEEGGSYGVGVSASLSRIPKNEFNLVISFDTDPEKRDRLLEIVWEEINSIKNNGPDASDLDEVKKSWIKLRKERLDKNGFWMGSIQSNMMSGYDFLSLEEYEKVINAISTKDIQKVVKKMMKNSNVVEVLMNPKK